MSPLVPLVAGGAAHQERGERGGDQLQLADVAVEPEEGRILRDQAQVHRQRLRGGPEVSTRDEGQGAKGVAKKRGGGLGGKMPGSETARR